MKVYVDEKDLPTGNPEKPYGDGCKYAVCDEWCYRCPFLHEENGDHVIIDSDFDCKKNCPLKTIQSVQNGKAVECLSEIIEYVASCNSLDMIDGKVRLDIVKRIRLKIEELKGEKNGTNN